ncbi:hypothetical protein ACOQFV_23180 [Nocardiopsis changdeensis]|uniref:DUF4232 domain-containing protein n=1 Tax=Nocardiopsis changdeensis TaxID=2831969 RepID=A0ABX8BNV8_9ACTN|nr:MULTISPECIES: hypothetical protein [Nocardiopsis]QUX23930.1 hypothetical protein KGD84_06265 [Nocardiopsis changdeensis]QYX39876.1 hypothetical protein K1J57_15720 [Nocardiopsis sp. MT53]
MHAGRARITAAAGAVALAAAAALAGGAAHAGEGEDPRPCRSDDFRVTEIDRGAAAGTMYVEFGLDRTGGGDPCLMSDRFGVHWTDVPGGDRVGEWARYSEEIRDPWVVPGDGRALLTMAQAEPGNFDPGDCGEVLTATGITVYQEFHGDPGVHGELSAPVRVCELEAGAPSMSVSPDG